MGSRTVSQPAVDSRSSPHSQPGRGTASGSGLQWPLRFNHSSTRAPSAGSWLVSELHPKKYRLRWCSAYAPRPFHNASSAAP